MTDAPLPPPARRRGPPPSPARAAMLASAPTTCASCSRPMQPRLCFSRHTQAWQPTLCCSPACTTAMMRQRAGRRPCPMCLRHWPGPNKGNDGPKVFCSRACYGKARVARHHGQHATAEGYAAATAARQHQREQREAERVARAIERAGQTVARPTFRRLAAAAPAAAGLCVICLSPWSRAACVTPRAITCGPACSAELKRRARRRQEHERRRRRVRALQPAGARHVHDDSAAPPTLQA